MENKDDIYYMYGSKEHGKEVINLLQSKIGHTENTCSLRGIAENRLYFTFNDRILCIKDDDNVIPALVKKCGIKLDL